MTAPFRNKALVWAAALVLTAAFVSIALGYPKEVAHPVLGGEWQCNRTAFLTSCTRVAPKPTLAELGNQPVPVGIIRAR
jgi:hypothetical protein